MLEAREWPKREDRRSPGRNIQFPLVAWFVNGGYVDDEGLWVKGEVRMKMLDAAAVVRQQHSPLSPLGLVT
jgi:hypothetical protein